MLVRNRYIVNHNMFSFWSRVHGDRSFHCDTCGVCLDVNLRGNHRCREGSARERNSPSNRFNDPHVRGAEALVQRSNRPFIRAKISRGLTKSRTIRINSQFVRKPLKARMAG